MELKIDQEFAEKIPPLTKEEFEQLEANILKDGIVINPLIVWNGVIVDGHNRYRILQEHPGIPFQVHQKEFADRYEAIAWICKNQLGRRNLTEAQRKYLIGKQYEAEKARITNAAGANQYSEEVGGQNDHQPKPEKTSVRIAKEIGKGEKYVRRAEEFALGLDAAEEVTPGIKQMILSGDIHPSDKDVAAVARAPSEERKALTEQLKAPRSSKRASPKPLWNFDQDVQDSDDDDEPEAVEFKPSTASILAISEEMDSSTVRVGSGIDTEFIILELENALESMVFRWETCIRDYRKEAMAKDCQKKIKGLVQEGIRYLQKYKGGVRDESD
jgi:ParB-like chromosome segregation protein Spo0J